MEHDGVSAELTGLLKFCPTIRFFVVCSGAIAERAIERASRSMPRGERKRFRHNKYVAWDQQFKALRADAPQLTTAQTKERVLGMQWGAAIWTDSTKDAIATARGFSTEMAALKRGGIGIASFRLSEEVAWISLWYD